MPKKENIVWFDRGMYQGGTERGYNSVNIFNNVYGIGVSFMGKHAQFWRISQ